MNRSVAGLKSSNGNKRRGNAKGEATRASEAAILHRETEGSVVF